MKQCMVDSSSAILLYKSDLFAHLVETYHIAMTDSVYEELTIAGYPGAREFLQYAENGSINIQSPPARQPGDGAEKSLYSMGRGERDTVRCYAAAGPFTFIILDDGRAVRYCRQTEIPFINALLFARIAYLAGLLPAAEYAEKYGELVRIGRYAQEVAAYARQCSCKDIALFLP
jgi:hypothetical protein